MERRLIEKLRNLAESKGMKLDLNHPIHNNDKDKYYYYICDDSLVKDCYFVVDVSDGTSYLEHDLEVNAMTIISDELIENSDYIKGSLFNSDILDLTLAELIFIYNGEIEIG